MRSDLASVPRDSPGSSSPVAEASSARASSSGSRPTATTSSAARRRDFDLTSMDDTERLFAETTPELVFHLAAEVGGIGANRANPGRYWYANLMMGAHVLEQARLHETPKLVIVGHGLRVSEVHAGPVPRGRALERLSRGDERPVRRREEDDPRRCPGIPRAVRDERDLPPADEPLRAGRQLRPRDVARDPRADPEDDRVTRRGRALGRRLADPRVPVRRRLRRRTCRSGRALRRARAGQPRHRRRDVDPGDRRAGRRSRRVRRVDHLGHVDAERSAAPQPRSLPRARALRLDALGRRSARGSRRRSRRSAPPSREHRGTRRPVPTPAATRGARAARPTPSRGTSSSRSGRSSSSRSGRPSRSSSRSRRTAGSPTRAATRSGS